MMYRYIALTWNSADPQQTDMAGLIQRKIHKDSTKWQSVFNQNGMQVFHAGERPGKMQACQLQTGMKRLGVILGKVFRRENDFKKSPVNTQIDNGESLEIFKSGGRPLIKNYWGRYVAFLYDETQKTHYILRDPTGAFPCFYIHYQGINIYFSDINDLARLGLLNVAINWQYLAAYLKYEFMQRSDTGLNEVTKLLPGECHKTTSNDATSSFYWNPGQICKNRVIEDPVHAAKHLRQVTLNCVKAWAECYSNIFHRLSGGLDSTIILSCLKQTEKPVNITCLNYFTSSMDGDERRYARLAARAAHCELLEKQLEPHNVDLGQILNMSKSVEPESYLFGIDRGRYETQLAQETNSEGIFSGHGGDNIYFQPRTHLGAVDFMQNHGLRPRLFRIAMEAARLGHSSVWAVLYGTFKHGLQKRPWSPLTDFFPEYNALINPEVLCSVNDDDVLHPWIGEAEDIPPGKLLHLMLATVSPLYYEPSFQPDRQPGPVNPLFSQPLIELCLQIPTYVLTTGGRDRGLARLAFKNSAVPEIINRESKGAGDQHYAKVFEGNIKFIREFLLDGILLKEKILDRKALKQALFGDQPDVDAARLQVLSLICTEAWLQHWSGE